MFESIILAATNIISHLENIEGLGFILLALLAFSIYQNLSGVVLFLILTIYLLTLHLNENFWFAYLAITLILLNPPLRKHLITKPIIFLIKKLGLLPKISETEKIALTSGTTWVDGELFSGKPNFKWIFSQKYPQLSEAEKKFLKNEVEEVCKMCDDFEVYQQRDLPKEVWRYLKTKKFFGMIIPKEFGGLGFSAYAHSCVIEKLASRSVPLAITVMVPNSLGPGELLLHYGTDEQKQYYLPRLSAGKEIPCFGLTEPTAGSDATSIISSGEVFKTKSGKIQIRLNWNKRYITLGAASTVIGLAFQLYDPKKLLGGNEEIGITCALIPAKTKGVILGRRHDPLSTPFVNSPINGKNVIINLDQIIGGKEGLGKGWKMLMECLAAGRCISLPSTASGGSKLVARVVSAHSIVREQFGTSIAKFEGVEEVLARIAAKTYIVDAVRKFSAGAVDLGAKPAVVSAIAKYHCTEMFRQNINDGMDILGGSGIIRGKRNLLANGYFSAPISITVEGANIMTRSLMHFGQGAIMCHPFAYKEINALANNDLTEFDLNFFAHIKHLIGNFVRSILLSVTRGYLIKPFCFSKTSKYKKKIAWASASFALLADLSIARYGGNLKRKEKLNGRFGDVLSGLYMATAVLKKFKADGSKQSDEILLQHAMQIIFSNMQIAFNGIYRNLFAGFGRFLILPFAFFARINALSSVPSDNLTHQIAKNFTQSGEFRNALTKGVFVPHDKDQALGRLENAMILHERNAEIIKKIKTAIKKKTLPNKRVEDLLTEAKKQSIISATEFRLAQEAFAAKLDAILVDEYSLKDYKNAF